MFDCGLFRGASPLRGLVLSRSALAPPLRSFSGAEARFVTTAARRFRSLHVSFAPRRSGSGEPSPDNVRPIEGRTGLKLYRGGADLLRGLSFENGYYNDGGEPTDSLNTRRITAYVPVTGGEELVICGRSPYSATTRVRVHEYDAEHGWLRQKLSVAAGEAYRLGWTVSDDAAYLRMSVPRFDDSPYCARCLCDEISWKNAAGTVWGGTLELVDGTLNVTMESADLGTLSWSCRELGGRRVFCCGELQDRIRKPSSTAFAPDWLVCSAYQTIPWDSRGEHSRGIALLTDGQLCVIDEALSDAEAFKAAVSGVRLAYGLAEGRLHALGARDVRALAGENRIWADAGELEAVLRAEAAP